MRERNCKSCGDPFIQFRSTQNLCDDCYYKKVKSAAPKQVRKMISHRGKRTKEWLEEDRPKWIKNHPPNENGYWECYLQIHAWCPHWINLSRLTLDHTVARSRDPSKRRKQSKLRPACRYCNELKGSRSIAQIIKAYPNSKVAKESIL